MAAKHSLIWRSPDNTPLGDLDGFVSLECGLVVNDKSTLVLGLPDFYDPMKFARDQRVYFTRIFGGLTQLIGNKDWLITGIDYTLSQREAAPTKLTLTDMNLLLDRHTVPYNSTTAYARKTGAAGTVMNAYVSENMGAGATDTTRDMSSILVASGGGAGLGVTSQDVSGQKLLKTFQDICSGLTMERSQFAAFDISVKDQSTGLLSFDVYTDQRGIDRRILNGPQQVSLSRQRGNLVEGHRIHDYTKGINQVYVGGPGQGVARVIVAVSSPTLKQFSLFGRSEDFFGAAEITGTSTYLTTQGYAFMDQNRPLDEFTGKVQETEDFLFGRDFNWGDRMWAEFGGELIDVRMNKLYINVSGGHEVIYGLVEAQLDASVS